MNFETKLNAQIKLIKQHNSVSSIWFNELLAVNILNKMRDYSAINLRLCLCSFVCSRLSYPMSNYIISNMLF